MQTKNKPSPTPTTSLPQGIEPLLTQRGLQDYYVVSDWTVNQWVRRGCPVEPTPFRGRRFNLTRVKAWVAAQESLAQTA